MHIFDIILELTHECDLDTQGNSPQNMQRLSAPQSKMDKRVSIFCLAY